VFSLPDCLLISFDEVNFGRGLKRHDMNGFGSTEWMMNAQVYHFCDDVFMLVISNKMKHKSLFGYFNLFSILVSSLILNHSSYL
jgi:hypothetical protein